MSNLGYPYIYLLFNDLPVISSRSSVNLTTMKDTNLTPFVLDRIVELYASTPNINHKDVAEEVGINIKTLYNIRKQPNFWAKVYDCYMSTFEGEIPDVLRAMIREARAGNTQAARLVLEHSGKLQQHLNIHVKSNFEKFMEVENA